MSTLAYTTSTSSARRDCQLQRPGTELVLSEATTIVLEPEDERGHGYVIIAGRRLKAFKISDEIGPDDQVGYFAVEGKEYTYEFALYANYVEMYKHSMTGDPQHPSYYNDVRVFETLGRFARFILDAFIPDCPESET